jgi:hypothetical protein
MLFIITEHHFLKLESIKHVSEQLAAVLHCNVNGTFHINHVFPCSTSHPRRLARIGATLARDFAEPSTHAVVELRSAPPRPSCYPFPEGKSPRATIRIASRAFLRFSEGS